MRIELDIVLGLPSDWASCPDIRQSMNHDLANPVVTRVNPRRFDIMLNGFAKTTVARNLL
jgi:hypothetical protein